MLVICPSISKVHYTNQPLHRYLTLSKKVFKNNILNDSKKYYIVKTSYKLFLNDLNRKYYNKKNLICESLQTQSHFSFSFYLLYRYHKQ